MVDPVSEPGLPQATPTRAPGFSRRRSGIAPTGVLGIPASPTPSNEGTNKPATPFAGMNAEKKREIIRKSVERLSQPKLVNAVCHRADAVSLLEPRNPPHSPFVRARSADVTMAEPVTPFEPIDPSRMLVANADRSGTAQRVPKPRFPRRGAALSASLFADSDERTPRPLRSNLLKRMGDYKPNKIVEETAAPEAVTEPVGTTSAEPILANASVHGSVVNTSATNFAERSIVVPPAPPPTAADTSCISLRAPAGKNAIPSTSAVCSRN
ncbi:hypothetical protein OESDEN_22557 [Oesophagostomum dentatum]|uniref:Uncharacterized protein n=1 Tax=Oesophagostomum dentatum TaxID=61180 RepID=A0A0B1RXM9_OESDE|nr:hypothetical protein OESDEN_22557 [Oesophagostomum dentatum]